MAYMMADGKLVKKEKTSNLRSFAPREFFVLLIAGFVAGAAVWFAKLGLDRWVMDPLFCRTPDTFAVCQNAGSIAFIVALVLVGVVTVSLLSLSKVYRPLLVVLASFVSIWGISIWLAPLVWWQAVLWCGAISLFAFALYGLIAQIKKFWLSFGITLALILVFQFVVRLI